MATLGKKGSQHQNDSSSLNPSTISLLEKIRAQGRVWEDLADQYGVTASDPPWKLSMTSTCEALAVNDCLGTLERRASEDDLSETVYQDVPQPERQLLALAHTMIQHGLVDEDELTRRMEQVSRRLNSV